ncbi:MAG: D-sedoheptulose 7-phosphate isomerase [Daejeonella sp.]|uniref:D-sedoheptulose 7-phosphate isomerase n=1 Tax=Daejeonella sp. TaxID=2805397 RepID=UPI0027333242|nr:D-sedoheptulose 7-phosphate isomerase [Daejeonella sp.]MDP3467100.1 D-sedoheptulose 7-phosphate isomerase [Daejeonella sp.]
MENIKSHFIEAKEVLDRFISDPQNFLNIEKAGEILVNAIKSGGKVISCGNGGSMSDAMHFAEELSGRYRNDRPAYPALAISDPGHLSCVANDYGYAFVFSRMLEAIGKEGDVLFAISTSGNSENILNAIEAARKKGMKVIGLTGKNGGKMAGLCDVEIRAPRSEYADRAQEIHIKVIHSLIDYVEVSLSV